MAEEKIQILIEAVDEATAVLRKIEDQVTNSGKAIVRSQEQTKKSFEVSTESLLAVGNAAESVDRIFSSYENLQLRLENASERVANAQDRLRDAQYKLHKTQQDASASAEDVANAQQNVEAASRGLTISQNNLARANNAAIGTYISMGVGIVELSVSIGKFITWINAARKAEELGNIVRAIGLALLNPIALALGLAAAAAGIYALKQMQATDASTKFNESQGATKTSVDSTTDALRAQKDAIDALSGKADEALSVQSPEEVAAAQKIHDQKAKIRDLELNQIRSGKTKEVEASANAISSEKALLANMQKDFDLRYTQDRALQKEQKDLIEKDASVHYSNLGQISYDSHAYMEKVITDFRIAVNNQYQQVIDKQAAIASFNNVYSGKGSANPFTGGAIMSTNKPYNAGNDVIAKLGLTPKGKITDGIVKSDGSFIQTDPSDTIMAMKDPGRMGGGMTIIIEGNIYGTNPDEMASALYDKIRRKISV